MKAPAEESSTNGSSSNCSFIKTSLSMTSLPPDEPQDTSEVIKAKLRMERPYNSLKKKRNTERELWRHSWGSNNSHSSCSLLGVSLRSGKDDFWAALQTNYNYIMDTNLLDTCREARGEIEGAASVAAKTQDCCHKMLCQSTRTEGSAEGPRELRKWLREMEYKLSSVPSLSEATQMSIAELQRRLAEHSVLYCEIVSHARVVGACVRASEKENEHSISSEEKTPSPNGSKKSDGNLKGLERRYHLLYLKAIEVQCLFEGLLGKKNSSSVLSRASSTETDDEPASKLARLSDSETQTHASASGDLLSREHTISDENKSEGDEDGEDWPDLAFSSILTTKQLQETNVDFDADSEGSDCEVDVKELNRHPAKKDKVNKFNKFKNDSILSENMDSNLCESGSLDYTVSEKKLQNSNQNLNRSPGSGSSGKKRQRTVDISKFNRSNRKSKNCAIFYFKHLDTDNENFGLSSQGSDALKSGEPSSDDEGWLFSNNGIEGQNILNDDSDKENKEIGVNISDVQATTVNLNIVEHSPKETMNNFDSPILNSTINEERERQIRCGLNHLKGEIHNEAVNTESPVGVAREKNKNLSETKTEMAEMSHKECSHESIKQLVLNAENLVREEVLKTPIKKKHSIIKVSTNKKREISMPGPNIQRVQEWLEHQPVSPKDNSLTGTPMTATDCEASGEYTESDSAARESDTSEGLTDSIATCMQTGSTSQCTSTEIIGGSAEPITNAGSNPNLTGVKIIRRTNRRSSDRPWSVSCLSQLTENDTNNSDKVNNNQGLASHSISESALHILSLPGKSKQSPQTPVKNSDSKNSLKRRKTRRRKLAGKRSDSGSDGILPYDLPKLTQSLMKSESISGQINIIQDLTMALSMINVSKSKMTEEKSTAEIESEEEQALMKPNFKLGSYTSAYMTNESKLGSLAALANYMNEEKGEYNTGTEDHSSFSEQAWDNYQEKYLSENYSEGFDSDAARKLLEFGDDYRNFLDSQSDCCSSLSAANNIDSLSPPRMDSLKQTEPKITQQTITSSVDHARRRRALELEYERRRKTAEMKKKSSQDEIHNLRSPTSSSTSYLTPKSSEKTITRTSSEASRKLDFGMSNSAQSLRRTSESDTSSRRRKSEEMLTMRRRSSRTLEKSFKAIPSSSSSNDDSDDEKEVKCLLTQSLNRLENTNALKIRSHLLRPEDYSEIITTCRDNIRCLESVLRGPPGTVLSTARSNETRDLLSSWENLLSWSENAGAARQMQEEMVVLKNALNRLGKQTCDFESESSIQFVIEELKNEKTQLQTYRTNMLRLNASVHSWLTRHEMKLKKELEALANEAENNNNSQEKGSQISSIVHSENEFHKHLKDEVSEMYSAWEEADARINNHVEALTASLIAWRQLECGLSEFHQVLGKDRGTLKGLEGALNKGQVTPVELAQNVKLVAKLLSEKVDVSQQQVSVTSDESVDASRIIHIAQFTSSNGSLSDSGISDGGATSDGGLSERERRLGALRRLVKQLQSVLAPGSDALKSITARVEAAEAELKTLQNSCRELIVRTAVSQHKSHALVSYNIPSSTKSQQRLKKSPPSKRKNKRKSLTGPISGTLVKNHKKYTGKQYAYAPDSGDPGDPKDDPWVLCTSDGDSDPKGGWAWRVAKIALPVQLALLTLFCAACLMEPHCCDSLNNFSMSFTPQLRYIRGPPPI